MTNFVQFPGLGLGFELSRVAFTIGGLNIYWYGIVIAAGLLLAVCFAMHYAPDFGINTDRFIDVIMIGGVCGIACARAFYVAFSPYPYDSLWDMVNLRDGGLAIYGAVIGAALFGGLACKWRKIPVLATFDVVSMGFLIGQGMGRWGNFFNQEAFGTNTSLPWGMYSESTQRYLQSVQATLAAQGVQVDPSQPVHPTFLYESIWCFAGLFLLWRHIKKRRFNGEIALWYAAWYGAGRFWIEGLRTDALMTPFFNLRVSQIIALVSVVGALAALAALRRKYKGRAFTVTPAIDYNRQAAYQKQWCEATGSSGGAVGYILSPIPAEASHKEFVQKTKEVNDELFDLSKVEERAAEFRRQLEQTKQGEDPESGAPAVQETAAPEASEAGEQAGTKDEEEQGGGTDH